MHPRFNPRGILAHYEAAWSRQATAMHRWLTGPSSQMPQGFEIAEFAPNEDRRMWTYATCGMSCQAEAAPIELHLFSATREPALVELLTVVAHYHLTGDYLDLNHTIYFGRPWQPGSLATHGLISLPYLDGPELEWGEIGSRSVRFLWLIPITQQEKEYSRSHGIDALERLFEQANFDYLDPNRPSIVQ